MKKISQAPKESKTTNVGNKPHPFLTEKDFNEPGYMFGPKQGKKYKQVPNPKSVY